ncbi:MAG: sugar transferase, partial [Clostridia bacterium]|nr:sugar transferase [Clostridia bacterium]
YREKVKAGLTGYAQIEGKYNTSPEDKLMLDLMYIENFSLLNDVRLIFRTLTVLFRKDSTEAFSQPDMVAEARGNKGKGRKRK